MAAALACIAPRPGTLRRGWRSGAVGVRYMRARLLRCAVTCPSQCPGRAQVRRDVLFARRVHMCRKLQTARQLVCQNGLLSCL